jgi:hypothetical protein
VNALTRHLESCLLFEIVFCFYKSLCSVQTVSLFPPLLDPCLVLPLPFPYMFLYIPLFHFTISHLSTFSSFHFTFTTSTHISLPPSPFSSFAYFCRFSHSSFRRLARTHSPQHRHIGAVFRCPQFLQQRYSNPTGHTVAHWLRH